MQRDLAKSAIGIEIKKTQILVTGGSALDGLAAALTKAVGGDGKSVVGLK